MTNDPEIYRKEVAQSDFQPGLTARQIVVQQQIDFFD